MFKMKISGIYGKILFFSAVIFNTLQLQNICLANSPKSFCSNYINISGKSNVNRFEFSMNFPLHEIFQVNHTYLNSPFIKKIYKINIPVKDFKAGSNAMYQDFITLLKADIYPEIIIGIGSDQLRKFRECEANIDQPIKITLAGITNEYSVSFVVNSCSDDLIYISGYKNLKLTDFNIDPPEKFQGLVKVKDEVMINFGFVFSYKD